MSAEIRTYHSLSNPALLSLDPKMHKRKVLLVGARMPILNIPEVAKRLDHLSVALTIADPQREDSSLIYANQSFFNLTGYECHEVLNRNCRFLQGNLENAAARSVIRDAIVKGKPAQATFDNLRKDGSPLTTLLLIEPLHDRDGKLVYVVGSQFELHKRVQEHDVKQHSDRVIDGISGLLALNANLRATTQRSLARSATATVRLWLET
ncbi:PAS domain-containing protein [Loktanella sp. SALINAS62]|uniref:PAS domain-containing protein n=1 Tax=Loktanella sp. SALINAS62 TaxID=2706124 RepID=UPI001B8B3817|nr:PAS domain-containing protein [Loktanella sp. SALINAS62]MBS1302306.1 PAS domain-containing protein [Loktanella sp. SALINAS62]